MQADAKRGTLDPVISVEFAAAMPAAGSRPRARVLYRESPMFHGIDPVFIPVLQNWLAELGQRKPVSR